jgi:hypothetical protein
VKFLGKKCDVHYGELILRALDYIVTISYGYILYCCCFNLFFNAWVCVCVGFVMCGVCNVCLCVCVGLVMCGCVYVWVL